MSRKRIERLSGHERPDRFELAMRAPDALHFAMVRRLDANLITLDRRLAAAARGLGIAVETPSGS
jgi:predicted nucleic acid-binding protein